MTSDTDLSAHAPERTTARRPVTRGRLAVRVIIMAVILALLLGGLYAFNNFRQKAIADFFAGNKPPPTPVSVAEAVAQSIPKYTTAIGTLTASRQVTVAPEVVGRVTQIFFESGARVKAGAPLVQLNDATDQADLLAYRAQAKLAENNLERARNLLRNQAGPQVTVDQNQAQLDGANANIKKTEALIAQKLIRAPFDGDLGIRQINVGEYVSAGAPIVTLTDLTNLFVDFTLPEQALSQIRIGQPVLVAADAAPGASFEAQISTIEPQVSPDTRAIKVRATLKNPERKLLPGMFANIRVIQPPAPNRIVVPETAVDYTVYGDSVFVVAARKDAEGKEGYVVNRVPVKTGDRFDSKVEILDGLKPGDRVVSSGQLKLNNGAAVVPTEASALVPPQTVPRN